MELQQGFVLTRHWRDTPEGTEVEFWLATDSGPRQVRLPVQTSVAFIPAEHRERAETLLRGEKDVELRPLALCDFQHRPVLGLYCKQHRQLMRLDKASTRDFIEISENIMGGASDVLDTKLLR